MNTIPQAGFYVPTNSEAFDKSVFSEYMDQDESSVLNWALNVTQKIYDKGLLPNFIERAKTDKVEDDKDFVDFWASVTIIFAYVVDLARKVGLENPNQEIFFMYLEQKNIFNCPDQTILELTYIASNYYDEVRKRGTTQVYKKKEGGNVDGEILRIVCYNLSLKDEFNFMLQEPDRTGWHVNRSSPLYNGFEGLQMANKTYEGGLIEDIAKYPQIGSPTIIDDGGENVIELNAGDGIGGTDLNFELVFHPTLCYQISFLVKGSGSFSFGATAFDNQGNLLSFKNVINDTDTSLFITSYTLPLSNEYYLVRGIIYPYNFLNIPDDLQTTNLNVGNNLKSLRGMRSILPQINCLTGTLLIKDFRFNISYLEWNSAFVQTNNFINIASTNRNGKLSPVEIYSAIRYYMLPYDCTLALKLLENLDEDEIIEEIDLTEVLLNKTNQGIISGTNLLLYTP